MKRLGLLILVSFFLMGCGTTELEERSFPMLVAIELEDGRVRYREAFPKEDTMGNLGAKEKDYNHLKVLVFEDDMLQNQNTYESVILEMTKKEQFPRNTYVCVMDDVEDLFEMEKGLSQDLGTYLEEYIKLHEEKKDHLLTLGDLMDEQANHVFVLYIPYLDVEDNMVIWKGYVNTSGKIGQESK